MNIRKKVNATQPNSNLIDHTHVSTGKIGIDQEISHKKTPHKWGIKSYFYSSSSNINNTESKCQRFFFVNLKIELKPQSQNSTEIESRKRSMNKKKRKDANK